MSLDDQREQLVAGLTAVAESLRNCADLAENFASALVHTAGLADHASHTNDAGATKSRKRKAAATEEATEGGKRKRNTKPKDPNAPKRPASSYILFQNEVRKQMKESHPNVSNTDLIAMIAKQWQEMSEQDKAVYNQAMASAKERYSADKKAYDSRTPEEVAAANATTAAALAIKKAAPRSRAPKAAAPVAVALPPVASTSQSSDHGSSDEFDGEESDDDDQGKEKVHDEEDDDDDDGDEDEEGSSSDDEPAPKKSKSKPDSGRVTTKVTPAVQNKRKQKGSK